MSQFYPIVAKKRPCSPAFFCPTLFQRNSYLAEVTRREQIGLKKGLEEEEEAEAQARKEGQKGRGKGRGGKGRGRGRGGKACGKDDGPPDDVENGDMKVTGPSDHDEEMDAKPSSSHEDPHTANKRKLSEDEMPQGSLQRKKKDKKVPAHPQKNDEDKDKKNEGMKAEEGEKNPLDLEKKTVDKKVAEKNDQGEKSASKKRAAKNEKFKAEAKKIDMDQEKATTDHGKKTAGTEDKQVHPGKTYEVRTKKVEAQNQKGDWEAYWEEQEDWAEDSRMQWEKGSKGWQDGQAAWDQEWEEDWEDWDQQEECHDSTKNKGKRGLAKDGQDQEGSTQKKTTAVAKKADEMPLETEDPKGKKEKTKSPTEETPAPETRKTRTRNPKKEAAENEETCKPKKRKQQTKTPKIPKVQEKQEKKSTEKNPEEDEETEKKPDENEGAKPKKAKNAKGSRLETGGSTEIKPKTRGKKAEKVEENKKEEKVEDAGKKVPGKTHKRQATDQDGEEGNEKAKAKNPKKGKGDDEGKPKTSPACFARRKCPSSTNGKAKWMALRDAFEGRIKPHLKTYSAHEDFNSFKWPSWFVTTFLTCVLKMV